MRIEDFSDKTALIDKEIESVLKGSTPNLHDAMHYHMSTGGKRVRPLLAILTCEALGGLVEKVVPFAAACELLHNWFLIHDDIEDGDKIRRNQPTVWVKYGMSHAINTGDYMAHKVFELILRCKERGVDDTTITKLFRETVDTTLCTAEGQTMDMNMRSSNSPTEEDYMKMVMGKTGRYLIMPMMGGAIIAGREDLADKIIEFGKCIGPAFQIRDDILDLTEGKGRNEIGRDIKEGKRSMMVVHCLQKATKLQKEKLLGVLNKPIEKTTNDDVIYAKSLFEKYGSIEYATKRAEELAEKAKDVSAQLPEKLQQIMDFFADYLVKRVK